MKKLLIFVCLLSIAICSGCESETSLEKSVTKEKGEKVLKCTRKVSNEDNFTADIRYNIYYKGDYVTKTVSIEKVTSDDKDTLKSYKDAYENVFKNYKDIDYYDNKVEQNGNTVSSVTVINYNKVDVNKIIELEGKEDNIFDDDLKVKKDTLVSFYKKYGVVCK